TYQDYEAQVVSPDRPPDRFVRFRMMGLFQSADERRLAAQGQFASLKFDPPPARPDGARPVGEWRRVEADLSPEKVHVRWRDDKGKMQTLLNWPGDRARQEYENLKAALEKNAPGVRAAGPRWSPRM